MSKCAGNIKHLVNRTIYGRGYSGYYSEIYRIRE
uniref:Uncharacterized protein n=1 Tax=Anguilla anguilla TaxID=7936 RepID=A0A0E9V4L8_ANGAN